MTAGDSETIGWRMKFVPAKTCGSKRAEAKWTSVRAGSSARANVARRTTCAKVTASATNRTRRTGSIAVAEGALRQLPPLGDVGAESVQIAPVGHGQRQPPGPHAVVVVDEEGGRHGLVAGEIRRPLQRQLKIGRGLLGRADRNQRGRFPVQVGQAARSGGVVVVGVEPLEAEQRRLDLANLAERAQLAVGQRLAG